MWEEITIDAVRELRFDRLPNGWPTGAVRIWLVDLKRNSADELHGDAMARAAIAHAVRISPIDIELGRDVHGRPTISLPASHSGPSPDVSIAKGEGCLVIGVSTAGRIGVDFEQIPRDAGGGGYCAPVTHWLHDVVRDQFTPSEQISLHALPVAEQVDRFFSIWTAKEAVAKAIGLGVSFDLREIEIRHLSANEIQLARLNGAQSLAAGWLLAQQNIEIDDARFTVTVASAGKAAK